ncbi:hypothetical protein NLX83_30710 [Allokutzneria sp. A3M-2-11 16]|uniref:hypothetical protein n=1 Tax=Allokutzneria sp. A3M-2-11 16 TaxID=2962043 RepID=UPI0020B76668|nr:hypothetical protein [Allokutzneria sp. A3M-2-11 16]MCP3803651.1 hypothetical protein [Allokutzneria sp. A3M-2-11 16]
MSAPVHAYRYGPTARVPQRRRRAAQAQRAALRARPTHITHPAESCYCPECYRPTSAGDVLFGIVGGLLLAGLIVGSGWLFGFYNLFA